MQSYATQLRHVLLRVIYSLQYQSADHLTFAYKYGSFAKIQEFVELRERLENSLHFAMTTVDKLLLELSWCDSSPSLFSALNNMHVQPHENLVRWDSLRDNRDLEVCALLFYTFVPATHSYMAQMALIR